MGAGTPVKVFYHHTGAQRYATRLDARKLVAIQDALAQVGFLCPTVTATDQGNYSDPVEIDGLLRKTTKSIVGRTLTPEHVDAAVEMLFTLADGAEAFHAAATSEFRYLVFSVGQ